MSEVEQFLANVQKEGQPPSESDQGKKETPPAPPAENKPKDGQPASPPAGEGKPSNTEDENNLPFHKHPRWIEREKELSELREFKQNAEPTLQKFSALTKTEQPAIPAPFVELFGDNPEAWAKWQELSKLQRQEIIKEIEAEQKQERERVAQAQAQIENSLKALETEGLKFDRNELLKIVDEYRPIDERGNWDFRKAYQILELQRKGQPSPTEEKKKIAGLAGGDSKPEPSGKKFLTPAQLRSRGWSGY